MIARRAGSRWWSRSCLTVVVAICSLAMVAASADASSVMKSAGVIVYLASDGEANSLTVSLQGTSYAFVEGSGVDIDGRCETITSGPSALCGSSGVSEIDIFLQDANDSLTINDSVAVAGQQRIVAEGGTGSDMLTGGAGPESLCGGPGNDTLNGGGGSDRLDFPCVDPQVDQTAGADELHGGAGDDQLNGGPAVAPLEADKIYGEGGIDTVDYSQRVAPLAISLDGVADDAQAGEGDNVAPDVENVVGGSGADVLTGSDAANVLDGGPANDKLFGRAADDRLDGGPGNDSLNGEGGVDVLTGDDGNDALNGGDGNDSLSGGGETDMLDGAAGDDTVRGGAGGDILDGGDGNDTLDGAEPGLVGADGNDTMDGGQGADVLHGGPGNDDLDGGLGRDVISGDDGPADTLTYRGRTKPVTVTLDDRPNDGERGEGDNVAGDVEIVVGGSLDDTFKGDGGDNTFHAGLGEDYLEGKAGPDILDAGVGSDLVWARDGVRDVVDCGGGGDLAVVDRDDETRNCRWRDRTGSRKPLVGQSALVRGKNFGYGTPVGEREYEDLAGSLKIPTGSRIDARSADVRVTVSGTAKSGRKEMAVSGGPFRLDLSRRATVYRFTAGARRCSRSGPRAPTDARTPRIVIRTKKRKGRPNKEQVEPAAVRSPESISSSPGTAWITERRCSGTLTRVLSGVVRVTDFTRHRTVMVRAGHSYLAPRKR
jgi:Ca2+-binding RTX toxin-like protein